MIHEIAFQTNMLSINAAVEAARAGQQGKGFAVVASTIRALSQRSGEAAKDIENLVGDTLEKVQNGTELVVQTADSLHQISEAASKTVELIGDIAAASTEQKNGAEQISTAIHQLDSVTQQNAALVEQIAASSQSMSGQAQDLLGLVKQFQVN